MMIAYSSRKVLAVWLDGYEHSLGEEMTSAGQMPAFARLREKSARFLIDHGPASRTGLAGEHVATGLAPEAANRWAAVHFDGSTYSAWQEGTGLAPFHGALHAKTAVFDPAYFALELVPEVMGIVNWGAHDPGVASSSRPTDLQSELDRRFGEYPAKRWLYGTAWTSVELTREMGLSLARAASLRADAATWLLTEKIPDWDLSLVAVSEPHSAIEGLWHGIDTTHPLHSAPSAGAAGEGVRAVYRAVDDLVDKLTAAVPRATVVLFAMHGMGSNRSDVASMLLLPELLYRLAFGETLFEAPAESRASPGQVPPMNPGQKWADWVRSCFRHDASGGAGKDGRSGSLQWMPAAWYAPYWPTMGCFALPSFYDGRIRINLEGRERLGVVRASECRAYCDRIEMLLRECIDPRTGESAIETVERATTTDPLRLGPTESDMVVVWRGAPCALRHPDLGLIGPAPYRRTGGHTGPNGFAWIAGEGVEPGDKGRASAFDIGPTLVHLVGEEPPPGMSGRSLAARLAAGHDP